MDEKEDLFDLFKVLPAIFTKHREIVEASIRAGWRLDSEIGRRIRIASFEGDTDEEKEERFEQFLRTIQTEGKFPPAWSSGERLCVISDILFGKRNDDGTLKTE